ncbi:MAG: hypothetical protein J6K39_03635 [Clostridia bacterium]|nr:hypothetical protein [Clostridia bacterium]
MARKDEELVLLATSIAMELANGLCMEELEDLRCLINQVLCSISTLISVKCNENKRKYDCKK